MTTSAAETPARNAPLSAALGFLRGAVARATGAEAAVAAQPFITVSNGRAGASWLTAGLGALADVDVDGEVKWRPPYQPAPMQMALESSEDRLSERLRQNSHGRPLVGSKLVFDAQQPFLRHELDDLLATIEPETKVVHVTRSYFEILKSAESRGGAPRARLSALAGAPQKLRDTALFQALAAEAQKPEIEDMFSGKPASSLAKALLVMFINDLVCARICEHVGPENSLRVRYEEIDQALPQVAAFLGSSAAEAEIGAVVANPPVEKYAPIADSFAPHFKLLMQIARELDAVRDLIIEGQWAMDAVWRDEQPPLVLPQKVGALLSMISALDVPSNIGLGEKLRAGLGI